LSQKYDVVFMGLKSDFPEARKAFAQKIANTHKMPPEKFSFLIQKSNVPIYTNLEYPVAEKTARWLTEIGAVVKLQIREEGQKPKPKIAYRKCPSCSSFNKLEAVRCSVCGIDFREQPAAASHGRITTTKPEIKSSDYISVNQLLKSSQKTPPPTSHLSNPASIDFNIFSPEKAKEEIKDATQPIELVPLDNRRPIALYPQTGTPPNHPYMNLPSAEPIKTHQTETERKIQPVDQPIFQKPMQPQKISPIQIPQQVQPLKQSFPQSQPIRQTIPPSAGITPGVRNQPLSKIAEVKPTAEELKEKFKTLTEKRKKEHILLESATPPLEVQSATRKDFPVKHELESKVPAKKTKRYPGLLFVFIFLYLIVIPGAMLFLGLDLNKQMIPPFMQDFERLVHVKVILYFIAAGLSAAAGLLLLTRKKFALTVAILVAILVPALLGLDYYLSKSTADFYSQSSSGFTMTVEIESKYFIPEIILRGLFFIFSFGYFLFSKNIKETFK
jgi:hypothetical protein